jgi:hypothetical protein
MKTNLVNLPQSDVDKIERAINRDATFLAAHNIMDYSLLLVIETVE